MKLPMRLLALLFLVFLAIAGPHLQASLVIAGPSGGAGQGEDGGTAPARGVPDDTYWKSWDGTVIKIDAVPDATGGVTVTATEPGGFPSVPVTGTRGADAAGKPTCTRTPKRPAPMTTSSGKKVTVANRKVYEKRKTPSGVFWLPMKQVDSKLYYNAI